MSASVLLLPVPLVLLVHLHILDYPHANKPEYDHNIFNARVRGLRERTKLLEDICYFLVERLEGTARTILAYYPCLHPSDTIAFRTSLAKYLESLRHRSLYPTSRVTAGCGGKSNRTQSNIQNKDAAWWWKDVVVRKSLLEECSGEKFERLLLSISTHVLHQCVSPFAMALPENASSLLRNQPFVYCDLLSKYNQIRHTWSDAASVLLQRQEDLNSIRERLDSDDGTTISKYTSLDTERLVALTGSRFRDLLRDLWRDQEGRRALEFLAELSGLKPLRSAVPPHHSQLKLTSHATEIHTVVPPPLPLPIAAAHHPANLKKIRRPVFLSVNPKPRSTVQHVVPDVAPPKTTRSLAKTVLSDQLDVEMRTQQALADALTRVKKIGQELASRVKDAKRKVKATVNSGFLLDLWQPDQTKYQPVKFDTQPTPELLSSLALYTPGTERTLDMRVDDLRESVLPPYPPVPDLSTPRPASIETQSFDPGSSHSKLSKIPRTNPQSTKALASVNESTDKYPSSSQQTSGPPPRQLVTSTPLPAVKPLSAVGQTTGKQSLRRESRAPRKSIRFSLANNRRPSLFAVDDHSDEEGEQEDEVSRIVRGTREGSFEDPHAPVTPKVKNQTVHRIFTGTKRSTVEKSKQLYPMAFREPPIALASLVSSSSSFNDLMTDAAPHDDDDADDWWMAEPVNGSNRSQEVQREVEAVSDDVDGYNDEGPSMTLRDILLRADTTQFDLLEEHDSEYLNDESFGWD